ncbi:hypothetical protein BH11PLA2_BH11PLA2_04750 [soil metagenome]
MMRSSGLMLLLLIPLLVLMPFGLLMTLLNVSRGSAKMTQSTNNLKQIGLGFHSYNDTANMLPYNGGTIVAKDLAAINFGWHNPNVRDSGTWASQILPFLEQDNLYRNIIPTGTANDKVPEWLTNKANNANWQVGVKTYICPGRERTGFKTDMGKDCYPGPVTDYAINVFLNSAPTTYGQLANKQNGFATNGGLPVEKNNRATIQGIADGSNNTIMVGSKALPPAYFNDNKATHWDEGIFSPGNYLAADEKSTITSTGTGRGHLVSPEVAGEDQKERPKIGGVPWIWKDSELIANEVEKKAIPEYAMDWGTPFNKGILFLWGDGTVRVMSHKIRGSINFARMLYPADGAVVVFD